MFLTLVYHKIKAICKQQWLNTASYWAFAFSESILLLISMKFRIKYKKPIISFELREQVCDNISSECINLLIISKDSNKTNYS